ncbi:adenine phosphoribosyltransferase [Nonlabens antarcticus]|uniref:adenine phosphoribosyltransferase n=1 Tax=Nonlabens antarcticus TaxID=392714 RepID=UPI001891AAEA|nr:adenine phosphoribosyltransferase [Nonlabens antarcticus]
MNDIDLNNYVQDIPDFPKKGILFKDISPILASAKARKHAVSLLALKYKNQKIDVVVGIEARGFLFGTLLADALNASFVMCRKPGKLPGKLEKVIYDLEYGSDSIEMQKNAFSKGSNVLLHDDVLATGGTAAAAIQLIDKVGGKLVGANFILEIDFLEGRKKLGNLKIESLLHY